MIVQRRRKGTKQNLEHKTKLAGKNLLRPEESKSKVWATEVGR